MLCLFVNLILIHDLTLTTYLISSSRAISKSTHLRFNHAIYSKLILIRLQHEQHTHHFSSHHVHTQLHIITPISIVYTLSLSSHSYHTSSQKTLLEFYGISYMINSTIPLGRLFHTCRILILGTFDLNLGLIL